MLRAAATAIAMALLVACSDSAPGPAEPTENDYILEVERGDPPEGAVRGIAAEVGAGSSSHVDILASATIRDSLFVLAKVADGTIVVNATRQADGSWSIPFIGAPLPEERLPPVPRGSGGVNLEISIGSPYGQAAGYVDPDADLVRCVNAARQPIDGTTPENGVAQVVTLPWCVVEVFSGGDLVYAHPVQGPEPAGEIGELDPHVPGEAELEVARTFVEAVDDGDPEAAIDLVDPIRAGDVTVPPLVALLDAEELHVSGDSEPFPLGYSFSLSARNLQLVVLLVKLDAGYRVYDWVVRGPLSP
jgi:hypothetical protein